MKLDNNEVSDEEDYHFSFNKRQQRNKIDSSSNSRAHNDDADYSSVSEDEGDNERQQKNEILELPPPIVLSNSPSSSGAYSKYANRSVYTILNVDDSGKKKESHKAKLSSLKLKDRSEKFSKRNLTTDSSPRETTLTSKKDIEEPKINKVTESNIAVIHSSSTVLNQSNISPMNKSSSGGLFWSGRSNSSFNSVLPDPSPTVQSSSSGGGDSKLNLNNGSGIRVVSSQEDLNTVGTGYDNNQVFREPRSSKQTNANTTEFCKRISTTSYLNSIKLARGADPKVLCASSDSTIHVYSVSDGTTYPALEGHTDRVIALAVSNPYFTYEDDTSNTNQSQNDDDDVGDTDQIKFNRQHKQVKKLKTLVASGSRDEMLKIWDLDSSKCIHTIHAHSCPIWAVNICVRKDGLVVVVSGAADGSLRSWNGKTGKRLLHFKAHTAKILSVFIVNPISDTPFMISAGCDKKIHVWELLSGKHVRLLEGHEDEVTSVYAGSFPGVTSLNPISNPGDVRNKIGELERSDGSSSNLSNNTSTNGMVIISGSRDLTVRVWHFNTGFLLFELFGHSGCIYGVSIIRCLGKFHVTDGGIVPEPSLLSPGTPVIVSCADDCTVRVWSLETGKLTKTFKWHSVNVRAMDTAVVFCSADKGDCSIKDYNPGVAMVASCGWDRSVRMHNLDEMLNEQESFCASCSLC